jgi:hypothetical protein
VVVDPGPKYRGEVFDPGRQGFRAKRDTNPACGSADLLWDHAPRHFAACQIPFLAVVSRRSSADR